MGISGSNDQTHIFNLISQSRTGAAALVLVFVGGEFASIVQMAATAVALAGIAVSARNADVQHLARASAPLIWICVLVPLFVVVQIAPLPSFLAHPIWASANEALQTQSFGHISVDLGETFNVFFLCLATLAIVAVTIMVTRDRRRAESVLFCLSAATTLQALLLLGRDLLPSIAQNDDPGVSVDLSGLGLLLSLAVIQLAVERHETRHDRRLTLSMGCAGVAAALINAAAIHRAGNIGTGVAIGFGVAVFGLILIIRRLDLPALPILALCIAAAVAALIVMTWLFETGPSGSTLLRPITAISADARATLERIIADNRWLGSGAGTLPAMGRIYQAGAEPVMLRAPSATIEIFVDMGWIGLTGAILITTMLLVKLFRGALDRGRDSFFSSAAAACVTFAAADGLVAPGLFEIPVIIILAVATGLGCSQSLSQSARQ